MDSKKLAQLCREYADNKKAENIVVLDVRKLSSVTDYFVVATGTSQPHLRAIVEEITSKLRDEHDLRPARTDGLTTGAWVVLDFFDVIIHVMHTEDAATVRSRGTLGRRQGDESRQAAKRNAAARKLTVADGAALSDR